MRRFFVDSLTGHRTMAKGSINRKPSRTWHVYDRAYNYELVSTHKTRRAAREHADALEKQCR